MPNNKMLIDASHEEETRVVVLKDGRVEEFDFEAAARKLLKGSIYLAKVTRVEPSLQAAFVDFGGNRHGFLAFNEIHPDYYQIPFADRQALLEEQAARRAEADDDDIEPADDADERPSFKVSDDDLDDGDADADELTSSADDEADDDASEDANETGDDNDTSVVKVQTITITEDGRVHEHAPETGDAGLPELPEAAIEVAEAAAVDVTDLLPPEPATDIAASSDTDGPPKPDDVPLRTAKDDTVQSPPIDADAEPQSDDVEQDAASAADETETQPEGDDTGAMADEADVIAEIAATDAGAQPNGAAYDAEAPQPQQPERRTSVARPTRRRVRSYKIQEVIKRRQIVLVQVVKEERGNKGAALTTYLSLAGRYTVLMPNTARGGGISRKITNAQDRKRLKSVVQELDVPEGMGLIVRTAGAARTKQEIKRDFEYLLRLWETVRDLTLNSTAPALVYEEGNLIKRAIRDLYSKEIDEVVVAGTDAHRSAKDFMRMLMPSHAKNVVRHEQPISLFKQFGVEPQLNALFSPIVTLPSGGYLVINQTEALVAIDINSGRSTREFSIEETAYKTNLEAAAEIARQLKLRDLAGLIVIDFIDMDEKRNNRGVERRLKECLKHDRARIQVGRISHFGLLEMSRQRLRTGMLEGSTTPCEHCQGTGIVRSVESVALSVLRAIEDAAEPNGADLVVTAPEAVAYYLLNHKRQFLMELETRCGIAIELVGSTEQQGTNFTVTAKDDRPLAGTGRRAVRAPARSPVSVEQGFETGPELVESGPAGSDAGDDEDGDGRRGRRRRRRRGGRRTERGDGETSVDIETDEDDAELAASDGADGDDASESGEGRTRRRGRRGGQRTRRRSSGAAADGDTVDVSAPNAPQPDVLGDDARPYIEQAKTVAAAASAARRRMVGERRPRSEARANRPDAATADVTAEESPNANGAAPAPETGEAADATAEARPPRRRSPRRRRRDTEPAAATDDATLPADTAASELDAPAAGAAPSDDAGEHASSAYRNGNATPEAEAGASGETAGPEDAEAKDDSPADEKGAPADEGEARPVRQHWGEPTASEPILKRLIVGEQESGEGAETTAEDAKPQRKGWWQRNFG